MLGTEGVPILPYLGSAQ